ncbi:MAG: hypothetical protein R3C19_05540 [Planctomycetaceae bacterium]
MTAARRIYAMLENESLWDAAVRCGQVLSDADIAYSVCGGVAVCLHGYQRNTVDLDLIVHPADADRVHNLLTKAGLVWDAGAKEFRTDSGVPVQFLLSGDDAGGGEVRIPEPAGGDNVETIDGLTVLRLSRIIEMKLACGMANMRRLHRDFADVVELIAVRQLDGSFSRLLHKSVRPAFRRLVRRVSGTDA